MESDPQSASYQEKNILTDDESPPEPADQAEQSQITQKESPSIDQGAIRMKTDHADRSTIEVEKLKASDDSVKDNSCKEREEISPIGERKTETHLTASEPGSVVVGKDVEKPESLCGETETETIGKEHKGSEVVESDELTSEEHVSDSKNVEESEPMKNGRTEGADITSNTDDQIIDSVSKDSSDTGNDETVSNFKENEEDAGGISLPDVNKEEADIHGSSPLTGTETVSSDKAEVSASTSQGSQKPNESSMEQGGETESAVKFSETDRAGDCPTSAIVEGENMDKKVGEESTEVQSSGDRAEPQGTETVGKVQTDVPTTATGDHGDAHIEEDGSSDRDDTATERQGETISSEKEDPENSKKDPEGKDEEKEEDKVAEDGEGKGKENLNDEEKGEDKQGEDEDDDDDDDDDDKESSAENKKRISRSSPIRCFDESIFTVEKLFEYQWPQSHGEYFFVQEQISEYLAVTSFKRKYPALERRLIGMEERQFLKDKGVVTEEQVTLGLTALKADEVYDVMQKDFPAKYSAYARLIQQRQRDAIKNKHKEYGTLAVDETKMKNYIKKAVRQAAEYNAQLMRQRREERQYYLDLQTMLIHCPKNKMKRLTKEQSKPGPYPVAVIPGQYQNYYKSYTPQELKYMPVNTAIYGPMATQKQSDIGPDLPPGGEVSSDDEDLSVSPEKPPKPEPKSSSKGTGKPPAKSTPNKSASKNGKNEKNDKNDQPKPTAEKDNKRLSVIEPPFDHEKINPAFFKEQVQSVLPEPPRDTPMMSLQPAPMVSAAPPPPVTQVLSQLLQQRGVLQPKPSAYVPKEIPDAICGLCLNDKGSNRRGEQEELVHCSQCDNSGHPSCLEMSPDLVHAIKTYPWQCMECKTCTLCGDPTHEDKMMFCDECDRGYHTFCVGLTDLPTGLWACASCRCVPPAQPLPPPPVDPPMVMTTLTTIPPPVNGSPESTTALSNVALKTPGRKNGTKRPAEPVVAEEGSKDGKTITEPIQAPTPPPTKKRNSKKKQATPAKS